jgi:hypothetical protein
VFAEHSLSRTYLRAVVADLDGERYKYVLQQHHNGSEETELYRLSGDEHDEDENLAGQHPALERYLDEALWSFADGEID